jgi:4-hydroxybenzoyl-CoA thioesterase
MNHDTTASAAAAPAGLVLRREIRVEWGDCDPAQIVFYPRYLAFFDASTAWLFEAAGIPKTELPRRFDIVGLPLVDVQAKFLLPCRFGDRLSAECNVREWRRSSFIVEHRLLREGKLAVQGHETRVWAGVDPARPDALQPRPIPPQVIERFSQ